VIFFATVRGVLPFMHVMPPSASGPASLTTHARHATTAGVDDDLRAANDNGP
jgi:hypothetical protein